MTTTSSARNHSNPSTIRSGATTTRTAVGPAAGTARTTARGDTVSASVTASATESSTGRAARYVSAALRLSLGWVFLWAFLDKLFALGFSTGRDGETGVVDRFGDAAWLNGGSPTEGFLGFATKGPFAGAYQSIAGATWADWGFMLGLAGIGTALILGIGMRVAAVAGAALLIMMWSAVLPPENNPFMDDHLVYAMVLIALALTGAGHTFGLGARWERLPIVQRYSFLK